jgi:hypothetical protein
MLRWEIGYLLVFRENETRIQRTDTCALSMQPPVISAVVLGEQFRRTEFNSIVSTLFPGSRVRSRKDSQSTVSRIIGCPVRIVHVGTPSTRHLQSRRSERMLTVSTMNDETQSFQSGCVIPWRSRRGLFRRSSCINQS